MTPVLLTDSVTPDLGRSVHYALLWGLEGVVLRTVGTPDSRVPFVNEQQLRARLAEAELPILAVIPGLFEGRVDEKAGWLNDQLLLDEVAAFCNRVSCPLIVTSALARLGADFDIDASAKALSKAGEIAGNYGVGLAVRNESMTNCPSGELLAQLVSTVGHEAVFAAWSPADALQAGFSPMDGLEALLDLCSIAIVMARDGVAGASAWVDCTPGEGDVTWPDQAQRLREAEFEGSMCLEVRGDSPARQGLAQASALIELMRNPL